MMKNSIKIFSKSLLTRLRIGKYFLPKSWFIQMPDALKLGRMVYVNHGHISWDIDGEKGKEESNYGLSRLNFQV